jgi:hypothetical protein
MFLILIGFLCGSATQRETGFQTRKDPKMTDLSQASPEKRKRGRVNDSSDAPRVEPEGRRRRGAQPGNLNALKHGLYIEGRSIRNTTPIERAELFDLNDIINYAKKFILANYIEGLKSKNLDELNISSRSISSHLGGLGRLMTLHNQFQNSSLPTDFVVTKKTTVMNLVDHYKKKLSTIIDLSEVESDLHSPSHAESDLQSPSPNSSLERG